MKGVPILYCDLIQLHVIYAHTHATILILNKQKWSTAWGNNRTNKNLIKKLLDIALRSLNSTKAMRYGGIEMGNVLALIQHKNQCFFPRHVRQII